MRVSRRSFFSAIAGAIAGAVASRALAVEPPDALTKERFELVKEQFGKAHERYVRVDTKTFSAKVKIPACLLEDSPHDWSSHVYHKFATECAGRVDRECWGPVGAEWGKKIDLPSLKAAMDSAPKPSHGFITINDVRALEGLNPLPDGGTARLFGYPVHVTPGLEGCWLSSRPVTLPEGWVPVSFHPIAGSTSFWDHA